MNKRYVWLFLAVFAVFNLVFPAVIAQDIFSDSFSPIANFNLGRVYDRFWPFLDFLFMAVLFVSVSHFALKKQFPGTPALPTVIGVILAVSSVYFANRIGFRLVDLGPFALTLGLVLIGLLVFNILNRAGMGMLSAGAWAFIFVWFGLSTLLATLIEANPGLRPLWGVGNILAVIALIAVLITGLQWGFSQMGGGQPPTAQQQPQPQQPPQQPQPQAQPAPQPRPAQARRNYHPAQQRRNYQPQQPPQQPQPQAQPAPQPQPQQNQVNMQAFNALQQLTQQAIPVFQVIQNHSPLLLQSLTNARAQARPPALPPNATPAQIQAAIAQSIGNARNHIQQIENQVNQFTQQINAMNQLVNNNNALQPQNAATFIQRFQALNPEIGALQANIARVATYIQGNNITKMDLQNAETNAIWIENRLNNLVTNLNPLIQVVNAGP